MTCFHLSAFDGDKSNSDCVGFLNHCGELDHKKDVELNKNEKKIQDNHENDCQDGRRDFEGEARDMPHPLVPIAKNLFSLPLGCNT